MVNRLRRNTDSLGVFGAWNEALPVILHLAKAHFERQVAEKFIQQVLSAQASLSPMLHVLCALYCLWRIEADMGWYMKHSYFSARKASAISEEIIR
jgi:hypothetical protein